MARVVPNTEKRFYLRALFLDRGSQEVMKINTDSTPIIPRISYQLPMIARPVYMWGRHS